MRPICFIQLYLRGVIAYPFRPVLICRVLSLSYRGYLYLFCLRYVIAFTFAIEGLVQLLANISIRNIVVPY